jgi:hypothetical protein
MTSKLRMIKSQKYKIWQQIITNAYIAKTPTKFYIYLT